MTELIPEVGTTVAVKKSAFNQLLGTLEGMGYNPIGPRIQDDILQIGPIEALEDLPRGYTSEQAAGRYRLVYSGHPRYFDITPGPASWKQYLFPPRADLFSVVRKGKNWITEENSEPTPIYAFVGVRPCDLSAIHVQDRVFFRENWSDPIYRSRRQSAFILAVNCTHPCGTCFCASLGTGPKASSGFDLNMTELEDMFLVEVGSEAGRMVIAGLPFQPASAFLLQNASRLIEDARKKMGRELPNPEELPALLLTHLEAQVWDEVATRCLSCTNCTQVCPTCFCWDVQDRPSLNGDLSMRERLWDSCFNPDYSYVAGGNTRTSTKARYRQWLTHKLGSWYPQFGVLGCVGCGRCITWCPAAIDITAEIASLRKEAAA